MEKNYRGKHLASKKTDGFLTKKAVRRALGLAMAVFFIMALLPMAMATDPVGPFCIEGTYVNQETTGTSVELTASTDQDMTAGGTISDPGHATGVTAGKTASGHTRVVHRPGAASGREWYAKLDKYAAHKSDDVFTINLRVEGNRIVPPPRPTVNVLVLDNSASMDATRIAALKAAAAAFLDQMTETDYVAIVRYATGSEYAKNDDGVIAFLPMTDGNKTTLKTYVNTNSTGNGVSDGTSGNANFTNAHGALIRAYQRLGDAPSSLVNPIYNVIFMTDGEPNMYYNHTLTDYATYSNFATGTTNGNNTAYWAPAANAALDAAAAIKAMSISPTIYSIMLGSSGANQETFLKAVASDKSGGGKQYYVGDSADFTNSFLQIAGQINPSITDGVIEDILPAGVEYIAGSAAAISVGTVPVLLTDAATPNIDVQEISGQTHIKWDNVPRLSQNQAVMLTLDVRVAICAWNGGTHPDHDIIETNAKATFTYTNAAATQDGHTGDYIALFPVPSVHAHAFNKLKVDKTSAQSTVSPYGGPVTYTVKVTNNYSDPMNTIVLTDTMTPAVAANKYAMVSVTDAATGNPAVTDVSVITVVDAAGSVVITLPAALEIAAGAALDITYTVTLPASGDAAYLNTAVADGLISGQPVRGSDDATVTQTDSPAYTLAKEVYSIAGNTSATTAQAGNEIIYKVTLKNTGNVNITAFDIDDVLQSTSFAAGDLKGPYGTADLAALLDWNAAIAAGQEQVRYYSYTVKTTDENNVINTVTTDNVEYDNGTKDEDEKEAEVTTPIIIPTVPNPPNEPNPPNDPNPPADPKPNPSPDPQPEPQPQPEPSPEPSPEPEIEEPMPDDDTPLSAPEVPITEDELPLTSGLPFSLIGIFGVLATGTGLLLGRKRRVGA